MTKKQKGKVRLAAYLRHNRLKSKPASLLKRFYAWANTELNSPFSPVSINRFRIARILIRQKHPLIAARVLLPGVFIGIVGSIGLLYTMNQNPPRVRAATDTANIWIATDGSSTCTRSTTAEDYPTAVSNGNVCDNGPDAYQVAQLGDTVLMEGGTYTAQWKFSVAMSKTGTAGTCSYNYGSVANLSNCVTFEPAAGQSVIFDVPGSPVSQISICANFISIQGVRINQTTYTDQFGDTLSNSAAGIGKGDNSCLPAGAPPHDIYLANNSYGGTVGITGGASNVWVVGGTAVSTSDLPWQLGGEGNNAGTTGVHNSGIVGMIFQGYNFVNGDSTHHHMECLHMDFAGDSNVIASDRFENCPVYGIRVEAEGTTVNGGDSQTNHLFENNFFDGGTNSASGALNFDCHDNNCVLTGDRVRFNSFADAGGFAPTNDCSLTSGNTCTVSNNTFYENVGGGCPSLAGWSTSYDVFGGAQSGQCTDDSTSAYNATINYVSAGSPNYDLHLANSQTAVDFVPTSVSGGCPSVDIDGTTRPQGSACDAGADEYVAPADTTANLWVAVNGSSTCTRSAIPVGYAAAVSAGNVCDNGPDAYKVANLGDTVLVKGGTYVTQWYFQDTSEKSGTAGTCNYNYGGASDFSSCVTFKPAGGETVTFNVPSPDLNTAQSQISICSAFIAVEDFNFTETDYTESSTGDVLSNAAIAAGKGDSTCGKSPDYVHDIYLHDNTYGGQVDFVGGSSNVWVVGGTAASTSDLPWEIGGGKSVDPTLVVNHSGVVGVIFKGYNFVNNDSVQHPMVCAISAGSQYETIANNKFEDCPVFAYELDPVSGVSTTGYANNTLVENNFFSRSTVPETAFLFFAAEGSSGQLNNNTVRFNSFYNSTGFHIDNKCAADVSTCTGTIDGNVVYGNVNPGCPTWATTGSMGGMMGTGWTFNYNVQSGTQQNFCDGDSTSTYNADISYVSPAFPNYDLHLAGAQVAVDFVPTSLTGGCPKTDIDGDSRPQGSACDAGADEYLASYIPPGNDSSGPSDSGSSSSSSGSSSSASLKGDCNNDGIVNLTDLSILLSHYGTNYSPADFDGNSLVNLTDLSILLSNYGK